LSVTNSTFSGNSSGYGGAIFTETGASTINNSTFSDNTAMYNGAGIYYQSGGLNLSNTILANSISGEDCYNVSGDSITTNINNLIETNGATGNMCGTPFATADPLLGPLANYGGSTNTFALQVGSPAIDTGDYLTCAALDQRGVTRPLGSSLCSIGAYEGTINAIITVDDNSDSVDFDPGDGSCSTSSVPGPCTLRAAIQEANARPGGDIIELPAGTYTLSIAGAVENLAATGDLDITDSLTINGAGASSTIIQAHATQGSGIDRVFHILGAGNVSISGVAIKNGKCAGCSGGGIANENSALTVTSSAFYGNSATSGGAGGGIYNINGSLTVLKSTFAGNSAPNGAGGGIDNGPGGTLTVANSTFSGNSAGSVGGGLENSGSAATVINSTFSGNSAAGGSNHGGGIWNNIGNTLNLKNTILANSVSNDDCYNQDGNAIASNINNLIEVNGPGGNMCGTPLISGDPVLGALLNNGGTTQTIAITNTSPAYNAGDNATCAAAPVNNVDQRGVARPYGAMCDIGAFELGSNIFTVTNTNNSGSGSLRQAILEANSTPNTTFGPDEIKFDIPGGPPHTITPGAALPTISDPVKIGGINNIILDGTSAGVGVDGLRLDTDNSVIRELTITNFDGAGVAVVDGTNIGNKFIQNSIYNNGSNNGNHDIPDVDLGDNGVTFNHVGVITGPNKYQNYPLLMLATSDDASLRVVGMLESDPSSNYTIEVYSNQSCHSTFFGGGETYLGSFNVTTNGSGFAKFDQTLAAAGIGETVGITATATGSNGTSEFSYCRPASSENLNWVQAQQISSGSSTQQYITDNYQEKWFKFAVHPGDTVHIELSDLAGSALSLHTDPNLIYNELINPDGATGLSAQAAGTAFLPSGSLPSGSLPSGSLPSGSLPSGSLPSGSLPTGFLPSGSLPSGSLPSGSLPSGSLPSGSLPSGSLPSGSLPSGSLPSGSLPSGSLPSGSLPPYLLPSGSLPSGSLSSGSLPSGSLAAYGAAARRSLIGISMNPYSTTQTIERNTYDYQGDLYIRVVGTYNLQTPFTLDVTVDAGACGSMQSVPNTEQVMSGSAPDGSYKSLLLTDSSRLEGTPEEIAVALADLQTLAARSDVAGVVIDLADAQYEGVAWANTQADANPLCPSARNMAADEIKKVIDEYRNANAGTLEYIVLAGGAAVIPYFQVQDVAGLADEKDYVVPVKPLTASEAGLKNNLVQGQDGYGSQLEVTQSGYTLDYPELAVGRLVDSASDISIAVNAYIATDGVITPSSSLVTGYDFVGDAAEAIKTEMNAGTNSTADTLIQPPGEAPDGPNTWTADQLRAKLFAGNFDIAVLTGHFSAGTLLAADYATQISAEEILYSDVDLNHVFFMTLGCHGGYTIPGDDMLNNATPDPDWAKAFLRKGAAGYVAATGYAYGDTELTEYGERLFVLMAKQLRTGSDPVSVGYAMMEAKRQYLADTAQLTGIDHKTIIETTLYGLPMMKVNMPGARITPSSDTSVATMYNPVGGGPGAALGLGDAPASLSPTVNTHTKSLENLSTDLPITTTYLSGANGVIANPFEPILPKQIYDVSVVGKILRGVAFRGGVYTDQTGIIPLTSAPTTETSTAHQSFNTEVFYPTQLWMTNYYDAFNGGDTRLVLFPSQFKSSAPGAINGTLRTFSNLNLQLYYLPDNWIDSSPEIQAAGVSAAPSISGASASEDNSNLVTFSVNASTDGSAGVQAVWVLYTGESGSPYHGAWTPLDLTQDPDDPTLWQGTLDLAAAGANAEDVRFMAQAVGGAGLTALDTNLGAYYTVTPFNAVPPPDPAPTTLSIVAPPASGTYRKDSAFTLQLTAPGDLTGKVVALDIGGQQALAVTNAVGEATITMNLMVAPGEYTVQAGFRGDREYLSSTDSSAFTVNKDTTAITTQISPISAVVKDSSGNELSGKSLVFVVHNLTDTFYRSVVTDYLGNARLGLIPLPPGAYTVDVYFNGTIPVYSTVLDDDYYESSSQLGLPLVISEWNEIRPPNITAHAKKADNTPYTADTWTKQTVTVHFTCSDTRSGIASCPVDQVFDTSGSFTANGTATDNAGNSASASFGLIKVDKTAPTLAPSVSPNPVNLNGSATASAGATDGGSGIASQSCGAVDTSVLGSKTVLCTATDNVGNSASANASYSVEDPILPTISASAKKADNTIYTVGEWTNQSVTVHFTCSDTLSGVASCPADQTFSANGSFTASGTATDGAGNSTSASFGPIKIDKTAPTLAPTVSPNPVNLNASATASAGATDGGSGIALQSCAAVNTSMLGSKTVACTATDNAGNTASANASYLVIDSTSPVISASATKTDGSVYTVGEWTNQSVTVHFTCSDTLSGVASCPADQVFSANGSFTATGAVTDAAGNSTSISFGPIKIDKTAPTLTPSVSPNPINLNGIATGNAGATDSDSGIASQSCDTIATNAVGARTATCTATDAAGNTASADAPYQVIYKFAGFFKPVHNLPARNQMQAGKAVTVVFSLNGNQGKIVFAAGYPKSTAVACGSGTIYNISTSAATSSSLKYNASTKRYVYTWKTNAKWAGTCRRLSLMFIDGRVYQLTFKFTQ
jgi:CSLREA domain-containing protein